MYISNLISSMVFLISLLNPTRNEDLQTILDSRMLILLSVTIRMMFIELAPFIKILQTKWLATYNVMTSLTWCIPRKFSLSSNSKEISILSFKKEFSIALSSFSI